MKTCFKCHVKKPLKDFYKHKDMKDGHLGKCKECTKKDVQARYHNPEHHQKIVEYEKRRFQDPERKRKALVYQKKRRRKHPLKEWARRTTRRKVKKLPCEVCGNPKSQAHHENYSNPYKVRWLCFRHHREAHGQTVN